MRKYTALLLLATLSLASCGDDDPVVVVEPLNKLTKISCYEEDNNSLLYSASVSYNVDGSIASIDFTGDTRRSFIYSDNKILMTKTQTGFKEAEYTLSGGRISRQENYKENDLVSNEIYVSDAYDYQYTGSDLSAIGWTTRWPKENGQGYEERVYPLSDIFTWENGNVVRYTRDKEEMTYTYGSLVNPENFTLRPIASFDLLSFDFVSPLNLLFGTNNRNLPERAYSYSVTEPSQYKSEYVFTYTFVSDYILEMKVVKQDEAGTRNTYLYKFEYDYKVN